MATTDTFRRQHEGLVQLSMEIVQGATPESMAADASDVRRRLARFVGRLKLHAAMENDALYPRLVDHPNAEVRDKARQLLRDVGGLYDELFAFARKWLSPGVIEASPAEFGNKLFHVMKILGKRMSRESRELYPLVDAAE